MNLPTRRVLLVDDTPAIHEDFRKILGRPMPSTVLEKLGSELFESATPWRSPSPRVAFELTHAFQGEEAVRLAEASMVENRPFAVAFVDMRMPPGWDGLETIRRLRLVDPRIQIVICTAYSDHSWTRITEVLNPGDDLLVLKKPFDNIEALQLAHTFCAKWELTRVVEGRLKELDNVARARAAELENAEQRFGAAFLGSSKAYAIVDVPSGSLLQTNPAFLTLLRADETILGSAVFDLKVWRDSAELLRALEGLAANGLPVEIELGVHSESDDLTEVRMTAAPFYEGAMRRALLGLIDISDRRRLERQLQQSQKMEAIGSLAAGIAHDFNNMLTVIQSGTSWAVAAPNLPADLSLQLGYVLEAGDKAAALTRQLLVFSRTQPAARLQIDPSDVVHKMEPMLRRIIGEDIILAVLCTSHGRTIMADVAHFEQILMNLVVNARDALPSGGSIRIVVDSVMTTTPNSRLQSSLRLKSHLRLRVIDNGVGMPPEVQARIFEPFFTTKGPEKGTGLGLSTVYGLVRQHEGWIEVESAPNHGTTFRLHFPECAETTAQPTECGESTALSRGHGERILAVEDEPAVREMLSTLLTDHGYEVVVAQDGPSALKEWEAHGGQFDLLVTDMIMPGGINGADLARQLRRASPSLSVLLATGYNDEMMEGLDFADAGPTPRLLRKPYDLTRLLHAVQQALPHGVPSPVVEGIA